MMVSQIKKKKYNNNNKERGLGDTLAFSHHITRII
jgi:hypothetical protein